MNRVIYTVKLSSMVSTNWQLQLYVSQKTTQIIHMTSLFEAQWYNHDWSALDTSSLLHIAVACPAGKAKIMFDPL